MSTSSFSVANLFDLKGRVALVTGGGTGIGWMIAEGLATNGAKVYITGRRKEVLENTAASFKQAHGTDNVIPAGQTGPLSKFFNDTDAPEHQSAETLGRALFDNESFEGWSEVYSINSASIFFVTTAFLGLLAKGSEDRPGYESCVVNISSISGHMKLAQNHFAYNSSKAAAAHLTKMLATEFALKKIPVRVCGVAPGVYESQMTAARLAQPNGVNHVGLGIIPVPSGRAGSAQEMAGTIIYLVSPAGGYTNGQEIIIDGGYLAVNPSRV
ncbi:hypothetical protein EIP86_006530 [Pleurotus ostreatoroseus]|nr:hypothetical protein EIP86_006530 [Pleurotus ostreatoroseus]